MVSNNQEMTQCVPATGFEQTPGLLGSASAKWGKISSYIISNLGISKEITDGKSISLPWAKLNKLDNFLNIRCEWAGTYDTFCIECLQGILYTASSTFCWEWCWVHICSAQCLFFSIYVMSFCNFLYICNLPYAAHKLSASRKAMWLGI